MLNVKTPEEVIDIVSSTFSPLSKSEKVEISKANQRTLAKDVVSCEDIPSFNRSMVDGYAVFAKDTFGCTEAIPAILKLQSVAIMGEDVKEKLERYNCIYVPTGGKVPEGADAVVMIEYTEKFSEDEIAITKPVSPGENMIYKGDDSKAGDIAVKKGTLLKPQHIGVFASLGIKEVEVTKKVVCSVISTGDELVQIDEVPKQGQVRDVNTYLLFSLLESFGCEVKSYGFLKDDEELLRNTIKDAISSSDMIVISGGSSVGQKDATAKIIEEFAPLLFHGIAVKPGKPSILASYDNKALIGLPGHPAASFFVANLFVKPIVDKLLGRNEEEYEVKAILDEAISANQGRALYIGVALRKENGMLHALPIQSKSGLISSLSKSNGFVCVPRDCEGFAKESIVSVRVF